MKSAFSNLSIKASEQYILPVSKPDTPTGASWPPVTARPSLSSTSYTSPQLLPAPKRTIFRDGVRISSFILSREKSTPSSIPAIPGCDVCPLPRTANCRPNVSIILIPIATCSVHSGTKTAEALSRAREPLPKELDRPPCQRRIRPSKRVPAILTSRAQLTYDSQDWMVEEHCREKVH